MCPLTLVNVVGADLLRSMVIMLLIRRLFSIPMYPIFSFRLRFVVHASMLYWESVRMFRRALLGACCSATWMAASSAELLVWGMFAGSRRLVLRGSEGAYQIPQPAMEFWSGPLVQEPSV